jgi:replicative DNA helicase
MTAATLAEQATLGGLLLQPDLLPVVGSWLRPGDFADPWHAAVFRALRETATVRTPITAVRVADTLTSRLDPARADLPRLHGLAAVVPVRPQPLVYARLVLHAAIARQVDQQGVLLRAGAVAAARHASPGDVIGVVRVVQGLLDQQRSRWDLAQSTRRGPAGRSAPTMVGGAASGPDAVAERPDPVAADRFLTAQPPRDPRGEVERERRLVGALLAHPDQAAAVAARLPVPAVHHPGWHAAYATVCDLALTGQPVDVVTVAWTLDHTDQPALAGRTTRGTPPNTTGGRVPVRDLLAAVEAGATLDPQYAAGLVAADALARTADTAAERLHALAVPPLQPVPQLLDQAQALLDPIVSIARALPDSHRTRQRHLSAVPAASPAVTADPCPGPAAS